MRKVVLLSSAALVIGLAFPAFASDDVAFRAIQSRDWPAAEKQLLAGLEKNPENVFRQLNLAWVYAQTGRKAEAAAIYQRILMADQGSVAALASRESASVKALAEKGLERLAIAN